MPSFINTNIASLNAQRNLNSSQMAQQTALQRLSSGLRINSAKDDAAGMAIASRMSSQVAGSIQAARNANDGISLAQTAEGDLTQISANLQRMRDLSVQSANATNSASDRAALNSEVQSLAQEIDRVAQNSSFNGVKLLDGTFTSQNFQIGAGATANDSIAIAAIASARTTQLGGASLTSNAVLISGPVTGALTAGALTLNGQQVGASAAGAAPGESIDSAIQIAAAINAVSAQSGVSATANSNSVVGAAATAFTAIAANTFNVNGINIGTVAAGTTATGQGANLAAAINLVANQTGVTAAANATTGAITMTAADGRNITITTSSAAKATLLTQTGLLTGNVSVIGGTQTTVSGAFTPASSTVANDFYFLNIDGINLYSAVATNIMPVTGAMIDSNWSNFATTNPGYSLTGNFAAGTAQISKADGTAIVINSYWTNNTFGTPANGTVSGGGIFGGAAPTAGAGVTTTFAAVGGAASNFGTISLSSTNAAGIVLSGSTPAIAGFTAGTTAAAGATFTSIASLNISTAAGASAALSAIDGAITSVNSSRANLGAYQNRFASVVTSLQTTTENLTASRSRIQDTDFAAETSALSRAQILQQAGTAMLAQANQLPNQVMTLLR